MQGLVAIYARVSTEDQAKKGYSIPEQLHECRRKAREISNDPIREYVDDGYTGEILERPALERMLDDIRKGLIHTVVCLSPDRLSRKTYVYLYITDVIDRHGVKLHYVTTTRENTAEGQLVEQILAAAAEYQKKKIIYDTARGRRAKARQGKVLRDFQVYGYDYDKETENFVINKDEAPIVYEIWERFVIRDHSMNSIAKDLTARGVPTKKGKTVWHRNVVRQILTNEIYTGTFYANKWNTEGMGLNKFKRPEDRVRIRLRPREEWIPIPTPAIVPKEWWTIVQEKLANNRKKYAGVRGVGGYLCSRLLRCGRCGNRMSGTPYKEWGKKVFVYTCRKNFAGAKNPGCGRHIHIEKIDEPVWDYIVKLVNNPDLIMKELETNDQPTPQQRELQRLERELEKAQKAKKRLIKLIANGLEDEDIEAELREWKEKEEKLLQRITALKELVAKEEIAAARVEYYRSVIEQLVKTDLDNMSTHEKNELARTLIREIIVHDDDVEILLY